jgi:uncharacterized protein (DUF302 family)
MSIPTEVQAELKMEMARGGEELTHSILAKAREVVPQCGIELVNVCIKRLPYVESVRENVYARLISERKRIAARFRSEGEGQSAEILGTMEKELRQIRSTAYRRVQKVRGKDHAEATRVSGAAYGADPEFYEFYAFSLSLETYKAAQNATSTVILTAHSYYYYYRYLKRADRPRAAPSAECDVHDKTIDFVLPVAATHACLGSRSMKSSPFFAAAAGWCGGSFPTLTARSPALPARSTRRGISVRVTASNYRSKPVRTWPPAASIGHEGPAQLHRLHRPILDRRGVLEFGADQGRGLRYQHRLRRMDAGLAAAVGLGAGAVPVRVQAALHFTRTRRAHGSDGRALVSSADPDRPGHPILGLGAVGHDAGDPAVRLPRRLCDPWHLGRRAAVLDGMRPRYVVGGSLADAAPGRASLRHTSSRGPSRQVTRFVPSVGAAAVTLRLSSRKETTMKIRSIFAALVLASASVITMAADGLITIKSPHSAKDTMNRLEAVVKEKGLNVFARIDHAAGAAKVGKSLRPTELLIFGNPQGGTPFIECAQTVGIDLPLKALVWEDASSQVWLGYNDTAFLAKRHEVPACAAAVNLANVVAAMAQAAVSP